ncbi:multifunctional CCA tRNA nucleotidyl transferase/2'3'-cyclic phosphodiesterase/2'nucleotidase/phosphatase [Salinisphaera sp. G21_0]|uniref:multifunctional CCA tRNA nucleotidyl transferase/2'3'-cyclic phosphodiesterase/2'nucleotidase/phosphatase n=1 Tax=Salinisphaera sp. G21_0 TaxID=2821094 RepID=UPI001ADCACA9|nr:multifunctional CCA tRNA nucleotidyl transferase/2'3'-cyclic phosphodiesterase/2'nucleotidase/phosphatase [Salinisphaera sp. G21_0]MBO9482756.1 multifunctional CCA tRNA nucleotidyl transferase/2'3'-cyclic phosphodiesterase/2'nucleotidase/phosphatase [Salinisphaera sp. G21_0]
MQVYRVGGAVRDQLLGLPVKDNDWVVVGATPGQMKDLGYQPVGRDFPVFLHPQTKEEYALARTERKTGHGYAGFSFYTSVDISLEEDLLRRDLTINAMAEDQHGNIIDPYGGQEDLKNRRLRHISPTFQEDPLRILRVARFAARLAPLGFQVAKETLELMGNMVNNGEAAHLVPERVWQETSRALMEPSPSVYFQTLESCGALQAVLPELRSLIHNQTLLHLTMAARDNNTALIRFGCLFSPLLPQAEAEKTNGILTVQGVSSRMRLPSEYADMALLVTEHAQSVASVIHSNDAESLMTLFEATDALRRPERFISLITILSYSFATVKLKKSQIIELLAGCLSIKARDLMTENITGKALGEALRQKRLQQIQSKMHLNK